MYTRETNAVRPINRDRAPTLMSAVRCKLHLEKLEARSLLSVTPFGGEIRVNTFTSAEQTTPAVAADPAGDHVVVWSSFGQDGSEYGVYAQRYNSAGVAQGIEFQVNTFTSHAQSDPVVAMDTAGDFVVAWRSYKQDGSDYGIYAQRFNALGSPQGGEFRVNTFTAGAQDTPAIAMDGNGDFVVAWASSGQDGSNYGVYAQRYNATGVAQGTEFLVNTFTTGVQDAPSVAMDSAGDFVVAWESFGQDGGGYGIYAQRYNANGTTSGGEFRVNTFTTGNQGSPAIAMDPNGDFVISWESLGQDGDSFGIFAQRFNSFGASLGSEFQANAFTTGPQSFPAVAMDSTGDFVVAWQSYAQDGSADGIFAQPYNSSGTAQGSPFQVNTFTTDVQDMAAVAMDANGDFAVAWESNLQDGSSFGIYAQHYQANRPPVIDPNGTDPGTYTNTWSLIGSPVTVVDPTLTAHGATITDPDDTNLASFTASIASPAAHDVLNATGQGNVTVTGNGTNTLTFRPTSGTATLADFQATLRTATYNNTTGDEGAGPKTINFTAADPFGGIGTATSQINIITGSSVTNRFLFYKDSSRYDQPGGTNGRPLSIPFSDDNAIASDKSAYLPNGASNLLSSEATFSNVSSYDQGINGIMVDLLGSGAHGSIGTGDFTIKVGNNNSPSTWAAGPTLTVSVRLGMTGAAQGAGTVSGSDRAELTWADGSITEKWVEVIVLADGNTGLAADDHFFFGNEIGATGASNTATIVKVGAPDVTDTQTHGATLKANIPVSNVYDFNKDGVVNAADVTDSQTHGTTVKTGLNLIQLGTPGPFAPDGAPAVASDTGVVSALASLSSTSSPVVIPPWIVDRLSHLDLNSGPIARYLRHLANEDTPRAREILVAADEVADSLGLDDALLDELVAGLGS